MIRYMILIIHDQFVVLNQVFTETTKNSLLRLLINCLLKSSRSHYPSILSKSKKDLELVSSFYNRAIKKLEMIFTGCTNV